ncbi:MAG: hypothetical protein ACRDPR_06685, partial [Nocardioidaceae bacterium]
GAGTTPSGAEAAAPAPATRWQVEDGTATVAAAAGLPASLRHNAADGTLELVTVVDGATVVDAVAVDGLTDVVVAGTSGDDWFRIDLTGGPLPVPVRFEGGEGADTVAGPSGDQVWDVSAPGGGVVAGVVFAGVEHLVGAAGNRDVFVFGPSGTLRGSVEGGDGGYDTIVLEGGAFETIAFTASRPDSGTIARDGDQLVYSGFEPITVNSVASTITITSTSAGADTITVRESGAAGDGQFEVVLSAGETHVITAAGSVTSLVLNAGVGGDTVTLESVDSTFTGTITVNGEAGSDTFAVPDVAGSWKITAVDTGSWEATGWPKVTFAGVENLTGAATAADAFDFESGAGLTGSVVDGAGTLTVSAVGFVKVSGDYDFATTSTSVTPTNGTPEIAVTANVLSVSGTGGTGFVGVEPLGNPVGIEGTLSDFALAIFTAGTRAWHAFDGTITTPELVSFTDLDLGLASMSVVLYDEADDDTWLNHTANPVTIGTKTFNSPSTLLSVSVPASLTISDVIHASGTFTFARGGTMTVDVATGFNGSAPATLTTALGALPVLASDDGTFGRSADYSTIYNLPVTSFQIAATNLNLFFGENFSWTDANADDVIQQSELGSGTTGFLLAGGDIGLLLLSGQTTSVTAFDAVVKPRFFALSGAIDSLGLVNVTEFALE